jgi:PilZ domain
MSPPSRESPPIGSGERRATRRYGLSLPIVVRIVSHKRSEPCHGRIRDISARGIYFITDEEFTPGAELEFTVALPVGVTQGTEVSLHAHSRVLRTEERREDDTRRTGVAAVIERIEYIRAEPAPS